VVFVWSDRCKWRNEVYSSNGIFAKATFFYGMKMVAPLHSIKSLLSIEEIRISGSFEREEVYITLKSCLIFEK
jgi:hypothetical protein